MSFTLPHLVPLYGSGELVRRPLLLLLLFLIWLQLLLPSLLLLQPVCCRCLEHILVQQRILAYVRSMHAAPRRQCEASPAAAAAAATPPLQPAAR